MDSLQPSPWKKRIEMLIDWFPLLGVTLVSLTAFLVYVAMRHSIISPSFETLEKIADVKEQELAEWFEKQEDKVLEAAEVLEDSPVIAKELDQGQESINSQERNQIKTLLENVTLLGSHSVALLNRGSIVVYATESDRKGQYQPVQNTGTYVTQETETQVIPNFYASPSDGTPMITLVSPLKDSEGQQIGFLAVDLDLDRIDQKIRRPPDAGEAHSKLESFLETYLVGRISPERNEFVAHSRASHTFGKGVNSTGINRAILEQQRGQDLYLNYKGDPVIGNYRWIPEYNLALLSEFDQYHIFQPARTLVAWVYGIGLSLTTIISIFLYLIKPKLIAVTKN